MPDTCPHCGEDSHSYECSQSLSLKLAESVQQHNEDLRDIAAMQAHEAHMLDRIEALEAEVRSLR